MAAELLGNHMKGYLRCLLLFALCLRFVALPFAAAAHGSGEIMLSDAPAGPYLLTVWVSPAEIKAGRPLHVTAGVALSDQGETKPVLDADIRVQIWEAGGDSPLASAAATTGQSVNKLLYETDLTVDEPGSYQVKVAVIGSEGSGENAFTIEVQPDSSIDWLPLALGALGLTVLAGLVRKFKDSGGEQGATH